MSKFKIIMDDEDPVEVAGDTVSINEAGILEVREKDAVVAAFAAGRWIYYTKA